MCHPFVQDMEWCQKYAFENRAAMLRSMVECVEEVTGKTPQMAKAINIHHNFCSCERCRYKVRTRVAAMDVLVGMPLTARS